MSVIVDNTEPDGPTDLTEAPRRPFVKYVFALCFSSNKKAV